MNLKKRTLVIALAVITALIATVSIVSGQNTHDKQSSPKAGERTIVGVWRTMVTPRNCQTGAAVAPAFPGLFAFNEGGTMSEYGISPGLSPALRSPGHGVWKRAHGWQDYSLSFTFYRYDVNGLFIGSQKITATLELGASGNDFTTSSSVEVLDAADNQIGNFCATAAGMRFE
jgi:hypothetical protein